MESTQFTGELVKGLIAILGLITTFYVMFYKPLHEVTIQLVKLNSNLENLNESDKRQNTIIADHEIRIQENRIDITKILSGEIHFTKDRRP